jgi:hypothetical protein
MISFAFCAISFREQPFNKSTLNHVKIFSEFQIFGVLLVCLIVQVHEQGFESELVTIDAYGAMQTALVIAIIPVVIYFLVRTCRDVKAEVKEDCDHGGMLWREDLHHDQEHESDEAEALRATNQPQDGSGQPKEPDHALQKDEMIAMLRDSLAMAQAENACLRGETLPTRQATNQPLDGTSPSPARRTATPPRPTTGLREPPPLHNLSASTPTAQQPQPATGALREPPRLARVRRP